MRLAFLLASMFLLSTAICPLAIAQEEMPQPPYIIVVEVSMPDGSPADGAQVFANNTRTGESQHSTTSGGRTALALAHYQQGDQIKIMAIKDGRRAENTIAPSLDGGGRQDGVPHVVGLRLEGAGDNTGIYLLAFAGAFAATLVFILLLVFIRRKKKEDNGEKRKTEARKEMVGKKEKGRKEMVGSKK